MMATDANKIALGAMVVAYMQCALWSSTGDDGEPLDGLYETWEISDESTASMIEDCENFLDQVDELDIDWRSCWTPEQLGHDLWLTRNGHGAGFWDRYSSADSRGDVGDRLTELAKPYGESNLYVGDDGNVHVS